jgi:WD40 repeat protein
MTDVLAPSGDALRGAPVCPYKGLESYTEKDKDYFFARDSFRDLIAVNLMASRLTVLYGPSGVGKSSLLQAGVMPLLRQAAEGAFSYLAVEDAIVVYCDSWRNDPLLELGGALLRAVPTPVAVSDLLEEHPALSLELLQKVASRLGADIYLLLDQFEELALYHPGASGEAFHSELGRIIKAPGLPVSVLLGVRDDALAKLDRLEPYVPRILDNKLRLEQLTRSEAREAIEQPLVRYNASVLPDRQVGIEQQLVNELLGQLQTGSVSVAEGGEGVLAGSDSVETPFLQLVMTRLWMAEAEAGSRLLHIETLQKLGGAAQIVRTHLDTVMAELTEEQRETAASVFRYLVTPSGMKISHTAEDLAYFVEGDPARVRDVLERLASARVVRPVPPPVGSNEPPRYEIFHDVMAPAVLDWRRRYVTEREWIASEASLVLEKQEVEHRHQATRRRLRLSRMLSIALALMLVVTGFLLWQVVRSGREAQQAALLARYGEMLRTDPAASLDFAMQAWHKHQTPRAQEAVRTALDADAERVRVQADNGPLSTSELSPDGRMFLTAGKDGIAKLFDAATGRLLLSFQPAGSEGGPELKAASLSPNGSLVLTVTTTGEVRLYNAATGTDLGLLSDSEQPNRGPDVQAVWGRVGGRLVVLISDWTKPAELWDAQRRLVITTYGTAATRDGAFSSDGRFIVAAESIESGDTYDARISVYDAGSGRLRQRSQVVGTAAFSARFAGTDSQRIVLYAMEKDSIYWHLTLWDWRKGSGNFLTAESESRTPGFIEVSKNGRLIAVPLDKSVLVYDAEIGEQVGETPEAPDWVNAALSFSPDGRWLATAGNDGRALVWMSDRLNNRPVAELLGHRGGLADVQFDPSSPSRLTTAGFDGTARIWQLPERTVLSSGGGWMLGAALSRDDRHLVTAEDGGVLRIYNYTPGAGADNQWREVDKATLNWYGRLIGASFTPDAQKIVAANEYSQSPAVWDWRSSDSFYELELWTDWISEPVVSAGGRSVAAGDRGGNVIVWDLESRNIIAQLAGTEGSIAMMVVAVPGSDWFAEASTDGTVRLWDPDRPEAPQQTFREKGGSPVRAIDVSADGTNLVSVSENHEVEVWRLSDGERIQAFEGPPSTNSDVAFNQDGSLVAISAADASVHIWHWADKHKLAALHRHGDLVNRVQFTADGRLVTASDDSTVAVFACTTCGSFDDVLKTARERVAAHKR